MKKLLFTVITTTYNRADYLDKVINSVLDQSYQNFELIIINDNSSDNTKEILNNYSNNNKIRIIDRKTNGKLARSRNTGISHAKGEYIVFLDDDDTFLPNRLQEQVKQLKRDNYKYKIYYAGTRNIKKEHTIDTIPQIKGDIWELLMDGWAPPVSSQCFQTEILKKINYYDTDIKSGIDHDIWMKLGKNNYQTGIIKKALVIPDSNNAVGEIKMTRNYKERINGIKKFLTKWKFLIIKKSGKNIYKKFHNRYLAREYFKFFMLSLANKDIKKMLFFSFLASRYHPVLLSKIFVMLIKIIFNKVIKQKKYSQNTKKIEAKMGYTINMK